jgi:membrane-bound metal-dependent hydrolase YbcI (DUF457 family)
MPLTPFHFGPSLLFGYPIRQRMDLVTLLVASVILDVRAILVFFGFLSGPTHGLLHHTYLGALTVALVFAGGVLLFSRRFPSIAQQISSRPESTKPVVLASVSGTWLHVTLDAFSHPGMDLFYPLSGNPLYHLIGPFLIYGLCMLAFLVFAGVVGVSTVQAVRKHGLAHDETRKRLGKITIISVILLMIVIVTILAIVLELKG